MDSLAEEYEDFKRDVEEKFLARRGRQSPQSRSWSRERSPSHNDESSGLALTSGVQLARNISELRENDHAESQTLQVALAESRQRVKDLENVLLGVQEDRHKLQVQVDSLRREEVFRSEWLGDYISENEDKCTMMVERTRRLGVGMRAFQTAVRQRYRREWMKAVNDGHGVEMNALRARMQSHEHNQHAKVLEFELQNVRREKAALAKEVHVIRLENSKKLTMQRALQHIRGVINRRKDRVATRMMRQSIQEMDALHALEKSDLETLVHDLRSQVVSLRETLADSEVKILELEGRAEMYKDMPSELSELRREYFGTKHIAKTEAEKGEIQAQTITELKERLHGIMESHRVEVERYRSEISQIREQYASQISSMKSAHQAAMESVKSDLLHEKNNDSKVHSSQIDRLRVTMEEERQRLRQDVVEQETIAAMEKQMRDAAEERLKERNADVEKLHKQISDMNSKIAECAMTERTLVEAENKISTLSEALSNVTVEGRTFVDKLEEKNTTIRTLQAHITERDQYVDALRREHFEEIAELRTFIQHSKEIESAYTEQMAQSRGMESENEGLRNLLREKTKWLEDALNDEREAHRITETKLREHEVEITRLSYAGQERDTLKAELERTQAMSQQASIKLIEAEARAEMLQSTNADLHHAREEIARLNRFEQEVIELRRQISDVRDELSREQRAHKQCEEQRITFETRLSEEKETVASLLEYKGKHALVDHLQTENERAKGEIDLLKADIERQKSETSRIIDGHNAEQKRMDEAHKADVERILEAHRLESERNAERHQVEMERTKDRHMIEMERKTNEISSLQGEVDTLRRLEPAEASNFKLSREVETLKAKLSDADALIASLRNQEAEIHRHAVDIERVNVETSAHLESQRRECASLQERLQEARSRADAEQSRANSILEREASRTEELSALQRRNEVLSAQLEESQRSSTALTTALEQQSSGLLGKLEGELKELSGEKERLRQEKEGLNSAIDVAMKQLEEKTKQLAESEARKEQDSLALAEAKRALSEAHVQADELNSDMKKRDHRIATLIENNKTLTADLEETRVSLESTRSELDTRNKEVVGLRTEVGDVKTQLVAETERCRQAIERKDKDYIRMVRETKRETDNSHRYEADAKALTVEVNRLAHERDSLKAKLDEVLQAQRREREELRENEKILRQNYDRESEAAKRRTEADMEVLRRNNSDAIDQIKKNNEEDRKKYEVEISELKARYEAVKKGLESDLEISRRRILEGEDQIRRQAQRDAEEARRIHLAEVDSLRQKALDERESIWAKASAEVEDVKKESNKKVDDLRSRLEKRIEDMTIQHDHEISVLQNELRVERDNSLRAQEQLMAQVGKGDVMDQLGRENDHLRTLLSTSEEDARKLRQEILGYEKKLLKAESDASTGNLKVLAFDSLQSKASTLEGELTRLREENQTLSQGLESLKHRVASLDLELSNERAKCSNLQNSLQKSRDDHQADISRWGEEKSGWERVHEREAAELQEAESALKLCRDERHKESKAHRKQDEKRLKNCGRALVWCKDRAFVARVMTAWRGVTTVSRLHRLMYYESALIHNRKAVAAAMQTWKRKHMAWKRTMRTMRVAVAKKDYSRTAKLRRFLIGWRHAAVWRRLIAERMNSSASRSDNARLHATITEKDEVLRREVKRLFFHRLHLATQLSKVGNSLYHIILDCHIGGKAPDHSRVALNKAADRIDREEAGLSSNSSLDEDDSLYAMAAHIRRSLVLRQANAVIQTECLGRLVTKLRCQKAMSMWISHLVRSRRNRAFALELNSIRTRFEQEIAVLENRAEADSMRHETEMDLGFEAQRRAMADVTSETAVYEKGYSSLLLRLRKLSAIYEWQNMKRMSIQQSVALSRLVSRFNHRKRLVAFTSWKSYVARKYRRRWTSVYKEEMRSSVLHAELQKQELASRHMTMSERVVMLEESNRTLSELCAKYEESVIQREGVEIQKLWWRSRLLRVGHFYRLWRSNARRVFMTRLASRKHVDFRVKYSARRSLLTSRPRPFSDIDIVQGRIGRQLLPEEVGAVLISTRASVNYLRHWMNRWLDAVAVKLHHQRVPDRRVKRVMTKRLLASAFANWKTCASNLYRKRAAGHYVTTAYSRVLWMFAQAAFSRWRTVTSQLTRKRAAVLLYKERKDRRRKAAAIRKWIRTLWRHYRRRNTHWKVFRAVVMMKMTNAFSLFKVNVAKAHARRRLQRTCEIADNAEREKNIIELEKDGLERTIRDMELEIASRNGIIEQLELNQDKLQSTVSHSEKRLHDEMVEWRTVSNEMQTQLRDVEGKLHAENQANQRLYLSRERMGIFLRRRLERRRLLSGIFQWQLAVRYVKWRRTNVNVTHRARGALVPIAAMREWRYAAAISHVWGKFKDYRHRNIIHCTRRSDRGSIRRLLYRWHGLWQTLKAKRAINAHVSFMRTRKGIHYTFDWWRTWAFTSRRMKPHATSFGQVVLGGGQLRMTRRRLANMGVRSIPGSRLSASGATFCQRALRGSHIRNMATMIGVTSIRKRMKRLFGLWGRVTKVRLGRWNRIMQVRRSITRSLSAHCLRRWLQYANARRFSHRRSIFSSHRASAYSRCKEVFSVWKGRCLLSRANQKISSLTTDLMKSRENATTLEAELGLEQMVVKGLQDKFDSLKGIHHLSLAVRDKLQFNNAELDQEVQEAYENMRSLESLLDSTQAAFAWSMRRYHLSRAFNSWWRISTINNMYSEAEGMVKDMRDQHELELERRTIAFNTLETTLNSEIEYLHAHTASVSARKTALRIWKETARWTRGIRVKSMKLIEKSRLLRLMAALNHMKIRFVRTIMKQRLEDSNALMLETKVGLAEEQSRSLESNENFLSYFRSLESRLQDTAAMLVDAEESEGMLYDVVRALWLRERLKSSFNQWRRCSDDSYSRSCRAVKAHYTCRILRARQALHHWRRTAYSLTRKKLRIRQVQTHLKNRQLKQVLNTFRRNAAIVHHRSAMHRRARRAILHISLSGVCTFWRHLVVTHKMADMERKRKMYRKELEENVQLLETLVDEKSAIITSEKEYSSGLLAEVDSLEKKMALLVTVNGWRIKSERTRSLGRESELRKMFVAYKLWVISQQRALHAGHVGRTILKLRKRRRLLKGLRNWQHVVMLDKSRKFDRIKKTLESTVVEKISREKELSLALFERDTLLGEKESLELRVMEEQKKAQMLVNVEKSTVTLVLQENALEDRLWLHRSGKESMARAFAHIRTLAVLRRFRRNKVLQISERVDHSKTSSALAIWKARRFSAEIRQMKGLARYANAEIHMLQKGLDALVHNYVKRRYFRGMTRVVEESEQIKRQTMYMEDMAKELNDTTLEQEAEIEGYKGLIQEQMDFARLQKTRLQIKVKLMGSFNAFKVNMLSKKPNKFTARALRSNLRIRAMYRSFYQWSEETMLVKAASENSAVQVATRAGAKESRELMRQMYITRKESQRGMFYLWFMHTRRSRYQKVVQLTSRSDLARKRAAFIGWRGGVLRRVLKVHLLLHDAGVVSPAAMKWSKDISRNASSGGMNLHEFLLSLSAQVKKRMLMWGMHVFQVSLFARRYKNIRRRMREEIILTEALRREADEGKNMLSDYGMNKEEAILRANQTATDLQRQVAKLSDDKAALQDELLSIMGDFASVRERLMAAQGTIQQKDIEIDKLLNSVTNTPVVSMKAAATSPGPHDFGDVGKDPSGLIEMLEERDKMISARDTQIRRLSKQLDDLIKANPLSPGVAGSGRKILGDISVTNTRGVKKPGARLLDWMKSDFLGPTEGEENNGLDSLRSTNHAKILAKLTPEQEEFFIEQLEMMQAALSKAIAEKDKMLKITVDRSDRMAEELRKCLERAEQQEALIEKLRIEVELERERRDEATIRQAQSELRLRSGSPLGRLKGNDSLLTPLPRDQLSPSPLPYTPASHLHLDFNDL